MTLNHRSNDNNNNKKRCCTHVFEDVELDGVVAHEDDQFVLWHAVRIAALVLDEDDELVADKVARHEVGARAGELEVTPVEGAEVLRADYHRLRCNQIQGAFGVTLVVVNWIRRNIVYNVILGFLFFFL